MTVNELIEQLKKVPGDSMVVIPGYEGGYDNPEIISSTLILDANWDGKEKNHWYNGRHAKYYANDNDSSVQPISCIVVGRGR